MTCSLKLAEVTMELASLRSFNSNPTGRSSAQENHQRGLRLYADRQYQEAAAFLQAALQDEATSERANDCAAANLACGNREKALADFVLAVSLDGENMDAAANLGILLASLARFREAIPYLQKSAARADASQRPALTQLLALCGNNVAEQTLLASRAAEEHAIAARRLPTIPSQPAAAPTRRPPVDFPSPETLTVEELSQAVGRHALLQVEIDQKIASHIVAMREEFRSTMNEVQALRAQMDQMVRGLADAVNSARGPQIRAPQSNPAGQLPMTTRSK
jgi:tetratricopeptide (TPR) repeat protein